MRGFLVGLVLIPVVIVGVLSIRPGGLRNQLRNVVRRLKLAIILGGVYLLASTSLRLYFRAGLTAEIATAVVAVVLAVIFLVRAQESAL